MGPREIHVLSEWEDRVIEGAILTSTDRTLADALASRQGGGLGVEELRSGVRLSARSWVGVVRFEAFEVRVVPKLAGDNLGLVRMIELTTGLEALRRVPAERHLEIAETLDLIDLIALLLVEATERIARGGFLSDYVEREEELPVVRGRLLAARQLRERYGQLDRLICRHDELEPDVLENQLLAYALDRCRLLVTDPDVRRRAGQLAGILRELCDPEELDLEEARRGIFYHRLNEYYREAHELAWLVLDALGVEDVLAPGTTRSFAFLIDMNLLFERFVHKILERSVSEIPATVHYQRRDRSIIWDEGAHRPYSAVIPDLLIEYPGPEGRVRLPIDAKYKLYDERHASPGDIYQSFLYTYAYGPHEGADVPAGAIAYPSSTGSLERRDLRVRTADGLQAARLVLLGIPVRQVLDEINLSVPPTVGTALAGILGTLVPANAR